MAAATTSPSAVEQVPGLIAGGPEPLPFGGGRLEIRSFLLERKRGNLLVYCNDALSASELRARGPIVRHYLGHWHEAMFLPTGHADLVGVPLVVHAADEAEAAERVDVTVHVFDRRHRVDDDIEVIPIPGHTPGATAYLWDAGEHRVLFSGDSLYVSGDRWVAAVLDSSDRGAYLESLELLRDLDFDVLAPWAASADAEPVALVEPAEARQRIEEVIVRVRRGASG